MFILTDDQGYGDLSAHGNPILKIHFADEVDVRHGVFVANADQDELVAAVDVADVHPEAAPRLLVRLDDAREEILPLHHGRQFRC